MDIPDWSWTDFPSASASASAIGSCPTLRCELNGWSALAAFLAGPEHAFEVPIAPQEVREQRDGESEVRRAPTDDERSIVRASVVEYLAVAGVPAPPEGIEWLLVLPSGSDPATFWSRLHHEMGQSTDFKPETARAVALAMSEALERLLRS